MKRLCAILIVGLLMMPVFSEVAKASSYRYSGKVYISNSYRYVGFTPQKIVIKTNIRWDGCPFEKGVLRYHGGYWTANSLTIKLYSWATYPYKHWFIQDQKTYHNTFSGTKCTHQEFSVSPSYYYKHWYDRFLGKRYLKFTITIPKDRDFYHHNSGKSKIYVSLRLGGAEVNLRTMSFSDFNMRVSGWGSYYTKPTPWEKYRRYWGYSMNVQDYNNLVANDNGTGVPTYEKLDTFQKVWIGLFIVMIIIAVPVVYNHLKKRG